MARDEAYQEAEQRIEQVRREGSTTLDLSGMGLTEVPEAIGSLTQLKELEIFHNYLTSLPEAIRSLTQLPNLLPTRQNTKPLQNNSNLASNPQRPFSKAAKKWEIG